MAKPSTVKGKVIGFDHPNGASKIFKSKTPSSRRLKAAYMFGPTLDELSHDKTARKNKRLRSNKKSRRIRERFVPQGCAPETCCFNEEELEKVRETFVAPIVIEVVVACSHFLFLSNSISEVVHLVCGGED